MCCRVSSGADLRVRRDGSGMLELARGALGAALRVPPIPAVRLVAILLGVRGVEDVPCLLLVLGRLELLVRVRVGDLWLVDVDARAMGLALLILVVVGVGLIGLAFQAFTLRALAFLALLDGRGRLGNGPSGAGGLLAR